jgi:hypothetical protein
LIGNVKNIVPFLHNYVQELVRYVHLNPVRAGICKDLAELEKYPWCGHSGLAGHNGRSFQDTETVLNRFGENVRDARANYKRFLDEGLKSGQEDDELVDLVRKSNSGRETGRKTGCWVIGDRKFVATAIASAEAIRLQVSRFEREGGTLENIAEGICSKFSVTREELRERHRGGDVSDARKALAYIAAKEYRAPLQIVAEYLGVGRTGASALSRQGREIANKMKVII